MKPQKNSTKQRILNSAIQEFAENGFWGARASQIAKRASVNKAMIFYYFSSKENLYRVIIQDSVKEIIIQVQKILADSKNPEDLFEALPEVYIRFFSKNRFLAKIIIHDLVQNPEHISKIVSQIFTQAPFKPQQVFTRMVRQWHQKGLVTESDPVHIILNIIPASLFCFIGLPMVESVLGQKINIDDEFIDERIHSVVNLIKRGMLP
ncbi:MAG: TetR family transcriptional regulator [Candidatus Aminicenantes bacterium]|nr:TetR family transcriptional regulator [Candidatus Aminicenantes bacterium]